MSKRRVRHRCGHTKPVELPLQHEPEHAEALIRPLERRLCPVCSDAKSKQDDRRFVSCPE